MVYQFVPGFLQVPRGLPVAWTAAVWPHSVTTAASLEDALMGEANDRDNGDADPDTFNVYLQWAPIEGVLDTFTHEFTQPGEHWYFCRLHHLVGMIGEVVVS